LGLVVYSHHLRQVQAASRELTGRTWLLGREVNCAAGRAPQDSLLLSQSMYKLRLSFCLEIGSRVLTLERRHELAQGSFSKQAQAGYDLQCNGPLRLFVFRVSRERVPC